MNFVDSGAMLDYIAKFGGAIVSTAACSEIEILAAIHDGRMYQDNNGRGFIIRPQVWLDRANGTISGGG